MRNDMTRNKVFFAASQHTSNIQLLANNLVEIVLKYVVVSCLHHVYWVTICYILQYSPHQELW